MLVIFFLKAIIMLYNFFLKNAGLMAMVLTAGIKQKQQTRNGKVERI